MYIIGIFQNQGENDAGKWSNDNYYTDLFIAIWIAELMCNHKLCSA